MLVRRTGCAKPCIIGDIDNQPRVIIDHHSGKFRKNYFKTNLNAQIGIFPPQRVTFSPRFEISHLFDDFTERGQPFLEGDVFSKWDKVGLVVSSVYFSARVNQVCAVIIFDFFPSG